MGMYSCVGYLQVYIYNIYILEEGSPPAGVAMDVNEGEEGAPPAGVEMDGNEGDPSCCC